MKIYLSFTIRSLTITNIDITKNIKSQYFKKLNKEKLMFRI